MRRLFLILLFLVAVGSTVGQVHSVQIGPGDTTICEGSSLRLWTSFSIGTFRYIGTYGGKDYFIDTVSRNWTDARAEARGKGLDLWVIETANENNAVYNFITKKDQPNSLFWIGLFQDANLENQSGPAAGWQWVTGKGLDPLSFVNWANGEPDNKFQNADMANYAAIGLIPNGSRWVDATNNPGSAYKGYAIAETDASDIITIWSTNQLNPQYIDVKPAEKTTYSVSVQYRGDPVSSRSVTVNVSPPQSVALFDIGPTSNTCLSKNQFVFNNLTSSSDPAATSYRWDFGDGNRSVLQSPTHRYSGAQSYTVKLIALDKLGCQSEFSKQLTVIPSPLIPVISFASKTRSFCEGDSLALTSVVIQQDPKVTYRWYFEGAQVAATKNFAARFSGKYTLEAINANGCRDSSFIELTATVRPKKPKLSVLSGFNEVFCDNDSTKVTADQSDPGLKYRWFRELNAEQQSLSGTGLKELTVYPPFALTGASVPMKYYVSVTDQNNCVSELSDPISLVVHPSPVASLSAKGAPVIFCDGDSVKIWGTTNFSESRFTWMLNTEALFTVPDSVFTAKKTGSYAVRVTNNFGCTSVSNSLDIVAHKFPVAPVLITDPEVPEKTPQGDVNICQGASTWLRASALEGARYQWYRDGAKMNGETMEKLTLSVGGKYKVTVSLNGCATTSKETSVGFLPPLNGVLEQPELPVICDGSTVTLKATGAASYQWYFNYNIIQGARGATYNTMKPGVYQVEFTSDKGCRSMGTDFVNLTLIRKPSARFSLDVYCAGTPAQLSNQSQSSQSGTVSYLWSFYDGKKSALENPVYQFPSAGSYKITLCVIPNACPQLLDSTSRNIQIEAAPPGIAYPAVNSMVGKSISLVARPIGDFYAWKPASGLNSPFIRIPLLNTPAKEQVYTVDITTRSGCKTVDTQLVRIFDEQQIFVPKGFTPNGDGNNDKVYPILVGIAVFKSIKIFNRWGVMVFQSSATDPEQGWDGTFKGEAQPSGTYTWVIDAVGENGRDIRKSGTIVLIR